MNTLYKRVALVTCLSALALTHTACGGSDNSDNNTTPPAGGGTPPADPTPVMMVEKSVGGSISFLSTSDQALNASTYAAATQIEIRVLDENGTVLSSRNTQANVVSNETRFETDITIPANEGSIVVNIEREGFAGYAKRYDFTRGEALNLSVLADLKQAQTMRFQVQDNTTVSGKRVEGFSFSVTRKADGSSVAKPGIQSKQAPDDEVLSVVVPASAVPTGVDSLSATVRSFDPNDTEDSSSFPGAYADSDGNTLLSVAFDFANVDLPDGTSMKSHVLAKRSAPGFSAKSSAAEDPVIINRAIPAASCSALESIGDADADMAGFQVPVYTYNSGSGLWDLLGKGTVYDDNAVMISADQSVFDCTVDDYTLEVEVTNEIFLSDWWNLDYPLVFDEPVELCANVELQNTEGQAVDQSVIWVFDDDDQRSFSQDYLVVDDSGKVQIKTVLIDGSDDRTVRLQVWDSFIQGGSQSQVVTLSENCDVNAEPVIVTVDRPMLCEVEGKLVYENGTSPDALPVYGFAENFFSFDFTNTDDEGNFSLDLVCDTPLEIQAFLANNDSSVSTNVNGLVGDNEQSDDETTVVLNDILIQPIAPIAFVFNAPEGDRFQNIVLTALDLDAGFPLTYDFDVIDSDENVVASFDGVLSEPTDAEDSPYTASITLSLTIPANAIYSTLGTIRDVTGEESEVVGFITGEQNTNQ